MNHKSTTSTPFINHPSIYVAGIDLGGEAEAGEDDYLKDLNPRHDSTVITIGEVQLPSSLINPKSCSLNQLHLTKVVEHYVWTGVRHTDLYPQMVDILKNVWHCRSVVVDATGLGQPVASFLRQALGSRVVPFEFTAPSKSGLGFDLLAAINSGRLKMYCADNSPEYREFWWEMEKARSYFRPSRTLNFYVDPSEGHDDYLMSLALLVRAARFNRDRSAHGLALNTAVGTG